MKTFLAVVTLFLTLSLPAAAQDTVVPLPGAAATTAILDGTSLVLVERTVPAGSMSLFSAYNGAYSDPVIVVEGFDPQNSASPLDVYDMLNAWGGVDIARAAGHSVWVLDFGDGGGALTANSSLVSAAVQLAANWGGLASAKVHVLGLSMGGVVSRYALARDEQNGGGSDGLVRLFVSGDSPQQGANGPISLQEIVLFGDDPSLTPLLGCDAALSMLYTSVRSYENNGCALGALPSATDWTGSSAAHDWFYAGLNALNGDGYPHKCRNVAVANGSFSPQAHNAGDTIYTARTYLSTIFGRTRLCTQAYPAQPMDVVPGSIGSNFAPGNIRTDSFELDEHFIATFIPTESALDIRDGVSKFARTISQTTAIGHSVITPETTDFILEELLGPDRRYNPKYLPDTVNASVYDWVVTAVFPGSFYIQSPERSSGLLVVSSELVAEGDVITVRGEMSSLAGERRIIASSVILVGSGNIARPLAMTNRDLGGGPVGLYTSGITGSESLNNIGMLVRTWGRVTQIGSGYLYVDDGSDLLDGTSTGSEANIGARVVCDPTGWQPGDRLVVTGISSCFETPAGNIARRILARGAEDLLKSVAP